MGTHLFAEETNGVVCLAEDDPYGDNKSISFHCEGLLDVWKL